MQIIYNQMINLIVVFEIGEIQNGIEVMTFLRDKFKCFSDAGSQDTVKFIDEVLREVKQGETVAGTS